MVNVDVGTQECPGQESNSPRVVMYVWLELWYAQLEGYRCAASRYLLAQRILDGQQDFVMGERLPEGVLGHPQVVKLSRPSSRRSHHPLVSGCSQRHRSSVGLVDSPLHCPCLVGLVLSF